MRFLEFRLDEALDNPYPFNLKGPDESQSFVATAQTPNGPLRMEFSSTDFDDFGIDFSIGKSMGKTDAGDEFRVFATVVAMMSEWISTVGIEHVEGFDFGADKTDHASDGRARLYTRFAKKLASQLGWKLEQSTTGNGSTSFFRLVNPKPIPRDDEYWDALEENFADGKKKVQEAFDNPYPIKWLSLRPDSSSSAKAKLDDGSELEIHFADDDAGYYDIEFLRSGSMKVSGEGDEFRVFATVQAAILEWWKQADKKYVRAISFSADKGDNNRSKLYKRFAEMWAKKIKWQFKSNDGRRDVEFSLIRPKAVEENFADGKKKGKSRPGRVKKSGASCNGSVTALRKRAKNSSGEKAKMYHWCANMKSGRKKK